MSKPRAQKDGLLSQQQMIDVRRRAQHMCQALDQENDEKLETFAIEAIKELDRAELVVLGSLIENHGYYKVAEAIVDEDLEFFGGSED